MPDVDVANFELTVQREHRKRLFDAIFVSLEDCDPDEQLEGLTRRLWLLQLGEIDDTADKEKWDRVRACVMERMDVLPREVQPSECARCKRRRLIPIIYGLPTWRTRAAVYLGLLSHGGCTLGTELWRCPLCAPTTRG